MSPASVASWGVSDWRMSVTEAKAEMMSDMGAVTRFCAPVAASFQTVDMLMESLPTGMVMPSAGQSSMPTACTAA